MEQMTVNGTQIAYKEAGRGDAVLLISPGPFRDGFNALTTLPELTTRFRLVTYRQRFFNRSTREPVRFVQHFPWFHKELQHIQQPEDLRFISRAYSALSGVWRIFRQKRADDRRRSRFCDELLRLLVLR